MPSPLAHVGVAWAVCASIEPAGSPLSATRWAVFAFAALAPDLDLLLVPWLGLDAHHGPSHSFMAAAAVGALAARAAGLARADHALAAACGALHVGLDWTTGTPDAPIHFGVMWAWPFSAARAMASNPWFLPYHIDRPGFLANVASWESVAPLARELGTVAATAVAAAATRALRRARRNPDEPAKGSATRTPRPPA